jgi:hypothetical protein
MSGNIEQAAARLRPAYETRVLVPPIRDLIDGADVDGAYQVHSCAWPPFVGSQDRADIAGGAETIWGVRAGLRRVVR